MTQLFINYQGWFADAISMTVHPKLHISTYIPCYSYLNISGAIQYKLPFTDYSLDSSWLWDNNSKLFYLKYRDAPKSANLIFPYPSDNIFPPFIYKII